MKEITLFEIVPTCGTTINYDLITYANNKKNNQTKTLKK